MLPTAETGRRRTDEKQQQRFKNQRASHNLEMRHPHFGKEKEPRQVAPLKSVGFLIVPSRRAFPSPTFA